MTIRETAQGRQALLDAAASSGRTLSDEIAQRLRQSFKYDLAGGSVNTAFLELLGAQIREIEADSGQSWRTDPGTWQKVRNALLREVEVRAPPPGAESQGPPVSAETADGPPDE